MISKVRQDSAKFSNWRPKATETGRLVAYAVRMGWIAAVKPSAMRLRTVSGAGGQIVESTPSRPGRYYLARITDAGSVPCSATKFKGLHLLEAFFIAWKAAPGRIARKRSPPPDLRYPGRNQAVQSDGRRPTHMPPAPRPQAAPWPCIQRRAQSVTGIHGLIRGAKQHFLAGRKVDEGQHPKPYKTT